MPYRGSPNHCTCSVSTEVKQRKEGTGGEGNNKKGRMNGKRGGERGRRGEEKRGGEEGRR